MRIEFNIVRGSFFGLLLVLCFSSSLVSGQSLTGSVSGKVINEKGEALDYVSVRVIQNGLIKYGQYTDENGNFKFKSITPGDYEVEVAYVGLHHDTKKIEIVASKDIKINITLKKDKNKKTRDVVIIKTICTDNRFNHHDSYNQQQIMNIMLGR